MDPSAILKAFSSVQDGRIPVQFFPSTKFSRQSSLAVFKTSAWVTKMVAEMAKIMLQTQNVAGQLGSWFRLSFVAVILSPRIFFPDASADCNFAKCKLNSTAGKLNWVSKSNYELSFKGSPSSVVSSCRQVSVYVANSFFKKVDCSTFYDTTR